MYICMTKKLNNFINYPMKAYIITAIIALAVVLVYDLILSKLLSKLMPSAGFGFDATKMARSEA